MALRPLVVVPAVLALLAGGGQAIPERARGADTARVLGVVDVRQQGSVNHDLVLVDGRGAVVRRLTTSRADEQTARFSPDGTRVVYRMAATAQSAPDLWLVNVDGTGRRNLTRTPHATEWSPEWTPDGRWIVFSCAAADGSTGVGNDLCAIRPDGTGRHAVVRSPATSEEYPTFAPTGRRMAYIRYGSATSFQVWVAKSDGSLPRALAATPAGDTWPAWSPDGRLIAYKHGSPGDIWVVRPDGTGRRNLTRTPDADEQLPAWLPDGRVTFVRGDGGRERSYGLWVIGRDGDGARLLAPHVSGWADWTR